MLFNPKKIFYQLCQIVLIIAEKTVGNTSSQYLQQHSGEVTIEDYILFISFHNSTTSTFQNCIREEL